MPTPISTQADKIDRQRRRKTDADETRGIKQRTRQQHRAPAMAVDDAADLRRDQSGDQQAERGAADHVAERPAGVVHDRLGKDRRKIERGAPGEDLGDAERGDDDAAVERRASPEDECKTYAALNPPAPCLLLLSIAAAVRAGEQS